MVSYNQPWQASGNGVLATIFHELGHMTSGGRELSQQYIFVKSEEDRSAAERYANDFGRTLTDHYLNTHLTFGPGADGYSIEHGSISFFTFSDQPDNDRLRPSIPSWKFDSVDGGSLIIG